MAYLTLSLYDEFRALQPYSALLPKPKQFTNLQDALKFCQDNHITFACTVTQWGGLGNDAEIEYQCSMNEVEDQAEQGEFWGDLDWM